MKDSTPGWLTPVLLLIAAVALLAPALLVRFAPAVPASAHHRLAALPARRVVPAAEVPPVEPVTFVALAPDDARAFNASVPFVTGAIPPARAFRFAGTPDDRARATDCLAAAVMYEAGDDTTGEAAVAQVILNRLRHPAFPKTVCGVVFEGSQRSTGCQFTFTCDGALTRWTPTPAGWARAQAVAAAALDGAVVKPVGLATHYHTNWVVPYWQSSLDKIAAVGTHLFFRWSGWWGTPGAFRAPAAQSEPAIAAMARLSEVHREGSGISDDDIAAAVAAGDDGTDEAATPVGGDPDSFLVTLRPTTAPAFYPSLAETACGARSRCVFSAWMDPRETPTALPLKPEQTASMSFAYYRDKASGVERTLWNCGQFPRADKRQCMKAQLAAPAATPAPGPTPAASPTPKGPTELDGVRRKPAQPAAAPTPRPTATPKPTPSPAALP